MILKHIKFAFPWCMLLLMAAINPAYAAKKDKQVSKVSETEIANKALEAYNSKDYELALRLARQVDNKSNRIADFVLGMLYVHGFAVDKNLPVGIEYLSKSCKSNHGAACHNLGVRYHRAEGVSHNPVKAVEYYLKACELLKAETCVDEFGKEYKIGPLPGGTYNNVHIVSDSVGIYIPYSGTVVLTNSIVEAPVGIKASGYRSVDVRYNDFNCDLAIEFTSSSSGNRAIGNKFAGRFSNDPNF